MAKSKVKSNTSPFTPEWLAGICKECFGESKIDDNVDPGRLKVTWGKNGSIATSVQQLEFQEHVNGTGGARNFVISFLNKAYPGEVPDFETEAEAKLKDKIKRKQGDKVESTDKALEAAGSSSKEKNETLKDL